MDERGRWKQENVNPRDTPRDENLGDSEGTRHEECYDESDKSCNDSFNDKISEGSLQDPNE